VPPADWPPGEMFTRTLEFAYVVIARSIRGTMSARQARRVPPRAIFFSPQVSFSNRPSRFACMATPRHVGTGRGWSPGTHHVSQPCRRVGPTTTPRETAETMHPWHAALFFLAIWSQMAPSTTLLANGPW
jgi:hypothetical protein